MNATGGDIIKLKDMIHTKWFELQHAKRSGGGHAFLQKLIYDEIVRLGHEALSTLKTIDPQSPFIKRIQGPLHEFQRKAWVAEDIGYIGPKPYYVMTPEAGQDAITQDINRLANAIHHAGMSLINSREEYCGCQISEFVEDLSSINTGVLKYCEGALKLNNNRRAWIHAPGDKVEHRPGSATNHANVIKFIPTEKGYDVEMKYMESGDANWMNRQDEVIGVVLEKGGKCEVEEKTAKCQIKDTSDDDIIDLALLISQLKDIDLMSEDCIPLAFQLITQQAEELKKIEPKENIWREPWTRVSDMSEIMECSEQTYEGDADRERREITKERRFRNDIDSLESMMEWAIRKSKTEGCTKYPYNCLADNDLSESIRESCERIKKETTYPFGWCMNLANQREKGIKEAAKDLVDRCPPEGIILGSEAENPEYVLYEISHIEKICKLAENQDCLDIIKQVEAREKAGIKPEKLKLEMRLEP